MTNQTVTNAMETAGKAVEVVNEAAQSEGFNNFLNGLTNAATMVSQKIMEIAPDVADALLNLVQFKGIFSLITAAVFLTGAAVFYFKGVYPKISKWAKDNERESDGFSWVVFAILSAPFGLLIVGNTIDLFSFYSWISAIYPEGAIALKALEAAGINL